MNPLPENLRSRLPLLFSQEAADEPFVYARLFLPGTSLNLYVLEGEATKEGFVMNCMFKGLEEVSFGHFSEAFLMEFRAPSGETVQLDAAFTEGKLTDVVPAPDL
jgi:hypothetical protein